MQVPARPGPGLPGPGGPVPAAPGQERRQGEGGSRTRRGVHPHGRQGGRRRRPGEEAHGGDLLRVLQTKVAIVSLISRPFLSISNPQHLAAEIKARLLDDGDTRRALGASALSFLANLSPEEQARFLRAEEGLLESGVGVDDLLPLPPALLIPNKRRRRRRREGHRYYDRVLLLVSSNGNPALLPINDASVR